MINNSENKFSNYSFEMAENRKKRKLFGAQQQYSFPPYECEKSGKENFSHVSNSHPVRLTIFLFIHLFTLNILIILCYYD
jgi:hypothetical protein